MGHGDVAGAEPAPRIRPADFDETFTRSFGPMVRSLAVACGDREVAADCVQEAFTRAFVRWARVSRLDDPAGWVRHVALNKIRDHFRKVERGRRALERLHTDAPEAAAPATEPSDLADRLASLPAQQRIAAALFYVEDLSVAEIAHAMNLSDGAVKYHLHAARASLREAMERQA
jgi:RNA polymerase sigma-70 factor (ECF subfamily)